MNKSNEVRLELIERYNETGRVGFTKPKNKEEAFSMIETISKLYENEPEEEVVISLSELTEKLKTFFDNY